MNLHPGKNLLIWKYTRYQLIRSSYHEINDHHSTNQSMIGCLTFFKGMMQVFNPSVVAAGKLGFSFSPVSFSSILYRKASSFRRYTVFIFLEIDYFSSVIVCIPAFRLFIVFILTWIDNRTVWPVFILVSVANS